MQQLSHLEKNDTLSEQLSKDIERHFSVLQNMIREERLVLAAECRHLRAVNKPVTSHIQADLNALKKKGEQLQELADQVGAQRALSLAPNVKSSIARTKDNLDKLTTEKCTHTVKSKGWTAAANEMEKFEKTKKVAE